MYSTVVLLKRLSDVTASAALEDVTDIVGARAAYLAHLKPSGTTNVAWEVRRSFVTPMDTA